MGGGVGTADATGETSVVPVGAGSFGETTLLLLPSADDATDWTPVVPVDAFSLPPSAAAFAAARAARSALVGRPRFFLGLASAGVSAVADAVDPASGATFSSLLIYLFPSSSWQKAMRRNAALLPSDLLSLNRCGLSSRRERPFRPRASAPPDAPPPARACNRAYASFGQSADLPWRRRRVLYHNPIRNATRKEEELLRGERGTGNGERGTGWLAKSRRRWRTRGCRMSSRARLASAVSRPKTSLASFLRSMPPSGAWIPAPKRTTIAGTAAPPGASSS